MTILFFGDIVGKGGRQAVAQILPKLRGKHSPDLVIANAENLAHGAGITFSTMNAVLDSGVDFFTSGNHVFDKPEANEVFQKFPDKIIRPANLSKTLPGSGYKLLNVGGQLVLMINLLGQVFMEKQFDLGEIGNPFLELNEILAAEEGKAVIKILDFHSEATSEKRAMGYWAEGRVSAVVGTHTHIPTADAQILPQGTGYISDIGMVGAANSVIGVTVEPVLRRFLGGNDTNLEVAEESPFEVDYVILEIDSKTGKCQNVNSFRTII